jgi:hypothetical protein
MTIGFAGVPALLLVNERLPLKVEPPWKKILSPAEYLPLKSDAVWGASHFRCDISSPQTVPTTDLRFARTK